MNAEERVTISKKELQEIHRTLHRTNICLKLARDNKKAAESKLKAEASTCSPSRFAELCNRVERATSRVQELTATFEEALEKLGQYAI